MINFSESIIATLYPVKEMSGVKREEVLKWRPIRLEIIGKPLLLDVMRTRKDERNRTVKPELMGQILISPFGQVQYPDDVFYYTPKEHGEKIIDLQKTGKEPYEGYRIREFGPHAKGTLFALNKSFIVYPEKVGVRYESLFIEHVAPETVTSSQT